MELSLIEGWTTVQSLLLFLIGVAVYAVFIFIFYKFLARKDLFKIDLSKYNTTRNPLWKKTLRVIFYVLEHILVYPVFVIFWFGILGLLLAFLSKNEGAQTILLVTAAVIGSVRITAYISENLSNDLAKMLPFALLGIFLIDISYFSIDHTQKVVFDVLPLWNTIVYYIIFIILLELFLRFAYETIFFMIHKRARKD